MSEPIVREFAHTAQIAAARKALVDVCRWMHQRGLIAARDGNVSVRIGERRMLVTPSGSRKGFMEPGDMVLCDMAGTPVAGESKQPSSEISMHVAIYEERPDVGGIVHAHPPYAIAHTISNADLSTPLMPEVFCELGTVEVIPYTTPTTMEVPAALRAPVRNGRVAMVMERHGSITLGTTLFEAYDRLEVLEHASKISMIASVLGGGKPKGLEAGQLENLRVFLGCGMGS